MTRLNTFFGCASCVVPLFLMSPRVINAQTDAAGPEELRQLQATIQRQQEQLQHQAEQLRRQSERLDFPQRQIDALRPAGPVSPPAASVAAAPALSRP